MSYLCSELTLVKALRRFLNEEPHSYRDEMVDFIEENFDIVVSLSTISRALAAAKISRKKVIPLKFYDI
jgi:arginine repressor